MSTPEEVPPQTEEEEVKVVPASEMIGSVVVDLKSISKTISSLSTKLRELESEIKRLESKNEKLERKKTVRKESVKPSGLQLEVDVSPEFGEFIKGEGEGEPTVTKISRVDAVKRIYEYINKNNLNDPKNGRCILLTSPAGKKLKEILNKDITKPKSKLKILDGREPKEGPKGEYNVLENEGLHIFNLQMLIKHHFTK